MKDLLNLSEEELSTYEPEDLEVLVRDSNLDVEQLAEVFVKHPILQNIILDYSDPVKLFYEIYYDKKDLEEDYIWQESCYEYKGMLSEYISALYSIKQYIYRNPYYSESLTGKEVLDIPIDDQDLCNPFVLSKTGGKSNLEELEKQLSELEREANNIKDEENFINNDGQSIGE